MYMNEILVILGSEMIKKYSKIESDKCNAIEIQSNFGYF